ncbi:hypothetical protein ACHAXS_013024 [Conticribra weissflogii]
MLFACSYEMARFTSLVTIRKGDIEGAIGHYTSGLDGLPLHPSKEDSAKFTLLASTLLSNRAMCRLKLAERASNIDGHGSNSSSSRQQQQQQQQQLQKECIDDCTLALQRLDSIRDGTSSKNNGISETEKNGLRSKILYRRAKALSLSISTPEMKNDATMINENEMESNLNSAAKDLLQLLSFDANNRDAASLLRKVRESHAKLGGGMGRSRISRALDALRSAGASTITMAVTADGDEKNDDDDAAPSANTRQPTPPEEFLPHLRLLQACLAEEGTSAAQEIGKRGGVPVLLPIARDRHQCQQARIAAIHILSACCSHDAFVVQYAMRETLPPQVLAQIVEEESALSNAKVCGNEKKGSADIAVVTMALLIRLILQWDHRQVLSFFSPKIREDGTVDNSGSGVDHNFPEVDPSSVCRVASAAFLWNCEEDDAASNEPVSTTGGNGNGQGHGHGDARVPRAALDLLSAWTAADLDALDAASAACAGISSSSSSSSSSYAKASHHRITPEEVRQMKPRQVAAHRKREAEYRNTNQQRARRHVSMFCSKETGGLDHMLTCAARARDHRLRREVGLQIGRLVSNFEEDDDVKKLVASSLGCADWKVGGDKEGNNGQERELHNLTIEELDEEDEGKDDVDMEEKTMEKGDDRLKKKLLQTMKRGQLTASLLIGKPEVGTWALKHGWSNGNGVSDLKELISSDDSRAMSIASEIVSAASTVESSRPLLSALVEEGTLEDLLSHPDADVRSGAASCAAKIGLASKALSEDRGEVMGLLDVAIELLFDETGQGDDGAPGAKENVLSAVKKLPKSTNRFSETESTSMDRGIEVMTYLAAKTFVKEKLASGYAPEGSPPGRKTALQRLVEIACAPNSGDAQMAYGLAGIFTLLSVSVETLRKEAFVGKDITKEQYDQLQALGKTKEEKEAEAKKDETEGDTPAAVSERIRKLANANVPRAIVKLLEGSNSDATQEKLLEGMNRMANESSVRGLMIQQGCLSTCLNIDKGDKPSDAEKKILRQARSCIAKLLVTTDPNILTVSQRSGSIGPLIKLIRDHDALDLMHFEALLSITNLASFGDETKNRIVAQNGISALGYAMFSDHEMVRRAATEAMCNMVPHPDMMEYLSKPDNLRVWVAFSLDYEDNYECARAAVGCLAMACPDPDFAKALVKCNNFREMVRTLLECGQIELMHRVLALIAGLIEHGGECRKAVEATGAGPFCDAYVVTYQDKSKIKELNFTSSQRESFVSTLSLAKEVARLLR